MAKSRLTDKEQVTQQIVHLPKGFQPACRMTKFCTQNKHISNDRKNLSLLMV
jgi:hypothetical protein